MQAIFARRAGVPANKRTGEGASDSFSEYTEGMEKPVRGREQRRDYGEQDAWGNSIGSLRLNLKLTPIERIRRAEEMARFVAKYRGAARTRTSD